MKTLLFFYSIFFARVELQYFRSKRYQLNK